MAELAPGPVVDVHAHHLGHEVLEAIGADGAQHGLRLIDGPRGPRVDLAGRTTGLPAFAALSDDDARLRWMDAAGVDVQLVAGWMDLAGYDLPQESALWLARVQNDALAALAARHPDRIAAAAVVPLQAPELAAAELRRAVTRLGHRAVQIGARAGDTGLDDPALDPFWAEAARLSVLVIVHPAELDVPERIRRLFLQILVGNPADTTFAAAALLLGGVLERFAGLRVLLVHGGGFLPYQLGRLQLAFERAPEAARPRTQSSLANLLNRVYCDSILHDQGALRYLVGAMGAEQIVLGSDYPFPMRDDAPVRSLEAAVEGPARELICGATAAALLGFDDGAAADALVWTSDEQCGVPAFPARLRRT